MQKCTRFAVQSSESPNLVQKCTRFAYGTPGSPNLVHTCTRFHPEPPLRRPHAGRTRRSREFPSAAGLPAPASRPLSGSWPPRCPTPGRPAVRRPAARCPAPGRPAVRLLAARCPAPASRPLSGSWPPRCPAPGRPLSGPRQPPAVRPPPAARCPAPASRPLSGSWPPAVRLLAARCPAPGRLARLTAGRRAAASAAAGRTKPGSLRSSSGS